MDKLTIAAWVNRSSAGSGYLVKKSDTSNGYRLWITATGTLQFELLFSGTTKTVTSTTTLPLNQWKHITARYDGTELRVFIDGTIESATTAATGSLAATTEALWLGYYDATNHHLHGHLDDVSIYDRALSDSEITDLVNDVDKRYEYHHINALGSNIVSTDDNQNVLARYEYDVFGAIRSETGTSDNTRKFTGKEFDADSNLYYYGARYYDPYIGRFTQRDPAGDGVNWYAYTRNNPLKFVDPNGEEPVQDHAGTLEQTMDILNSETLNWRNIGGATGAQASSVLADLGDAGLKGPKHNPMGNQKGRYLYTKKGGWIDMRHFLFFAGQAWANKQLAGSLVDEDAIADGTVTDSIIMEMLQMIAGHGSGFSYEDLPSNKYGAEFGAKHFDPNSSLTLGQQMQDFLNNLDPVNPKDAPNWNDVPATTDNLDDEGYKTPKNYTTTPKHTTITDN